MTSIRLMIAGMLGMALSASAWGADVVKEVEIKLEPVNFVQLERAIAAHKGKVVLVDVWGEFCLPCKKKFPHVVQMHKDWAKDGLVVISLSVDDPDNKIRALDFLKKNAATFQNFLLDDTEENKDKWEKKLAHTAPPILHVFDRSGKLVKSFEFEKAEEIDKFVQEVLKAK